MNEQLAAFLELEAAVRARGDSVRSTAAPAFAYRSMGSLAAVCGTLRR